MNEGTNQPVSVNSSSNPLEASGSGIRTQLLWASLFPLAFFVLLTTLVISTALFRVTLNLVLQRNTAQAQVVAYTLLSEGSLAHLNVPSTLKTALQKIHPVEGSVLFVVDSNGHILGKSESDQNMMPCKSFRSNAIDPGMESSQYLGRIDHCQRPNGHIFRPNSRRTYGGSD